MAETTLISWCDCTFNPWIGCTKVTPACDGCYAENLMDKRHHRVAWGGPRVRTSAIYWRQPVRWNAAAQAAGTRPFVFCASLADVFDNQVPPEWRADLFNLIGATPNLVWLLLTKRPQNIVKMVKAVGFMPPNIAFGTTCEDRKRVETNLPHLMVAAGLRPLFLFASFEPLLECVGDLSPWLLGDPWPQRLKEGYRYEKGFKVPADGMLKIEDLPALAWAITGGDKNQGTHRGRPSHPDWFRGVRNQCAFYGTAYHHKQNGEWAPGEAIINPIMTRSEQGAWLGEDGWHTQTITPREAEDLHCDDEPDVWCVGNRRAGRFLDATIHNERPEP